MNIPIRTVSRALARAGIAGAIITGCSRDMVEPVSARNPRVFAIRITPSPDVYAQGNVPLLLRAAALDSAGNILPDTKIEWSVAGGPTSAALAPKIEPGYGTPAIAWLTIVVADVVTVTARHEKVVAAVVVHRVPTPK